MSLLSIAVTTLGHDAVSLTGGQCSILTTSDHNQASIREIKVRRIRDELAAGRIVIVAGFQGVDANNEITTLGRGGSDTTAVALAAALSADHCDIFSDVDGIYSADPRIVPTARRLETLCYEEMHELSRHGARVLHAEAVEFAARQGIAIFARSTFGTDHSTLVKSREELKRDGDVSSGDTISGVAGRTDLIRIRGSRSPGENPGQAINHLDVLHREYDEAHIDAVVSTENEPSKEALAGWLSATLPNHYSIQSDVGSVAVIGRGVGTSAPLRERAQRSLAQAGIPVFGGFSRPDSLACVVRVDAVTDSMRTLHRAFVEQAIPELEKAACA